MARPKVTTSPVADQYAASSGNERIIEFNSGEAGGPGGLISFRRMDSGDLDVQVYRTDDGVHVQLAQDYPHTRYAFIDDGATDDDEPVAVGPFPTEEGAQLHANGRRVIALVSLDVWRKDRP